MGAFWSMARAMVRSCFCPAEMPALSESTVSNPCGSEWMSLSSPHARQTASSCSSVMPSMLYTRFSRTVPSKSQVSCKTMLKRPCTSSRRISEMGTPSIVMLPLLISKNRMRRLTIVVLPAPVGPTMATFCPGEHLGGKVPDDDLVRVTRIAEPDVVKADPAAHIGELRGLFRSRRASPRFRENRRCGARRRRRSACSSCPAPSASAAR